MLSSAISLWMDRLYGFPWFFHRVKRCCRGWRNSSIGLQFGLRLRLCLWLRMSLNLRPKRGIRLNLYLWLRLKNCNWLICCLCGFWWQDCFSHTDLRIKPKQTLLGVYITYFHLIFTCAVNLATDNDTNTRLMIELFSIPILIQHDKTTYQTNKQKHM